MNLAEYLQNKPLYYKEIDYSRMPRAYESIKDKLRIPKIIQIIGTNGKGSTGRFLASMLMRQGLFVGHYTSPHVFKFNERIWLNGEDVSDDILGDAHQRLQKLLPLEFIESLSYFEYATFLAILIFCENCDYVVLEAGLGGEFDATSVFPKILSVVTPIGYDHSSFLGKSIKEIATTKINSITTTTLLSNQYEEEVYKVAQKISDKRGIKLFLSQDILSKQEKKDVQTYTQKNRLPTFQNINLQAALSAAKLLGFEIDFDNIKLPTMFARCQKLTPNITIDVGHNIMAAKMIAQNFKDQKIVLIYNSYKDKEYEQIISILTPVIKRIEILHVEDQRGMAGDDIERICKEKQIQVSFFTEIKADEQYLVFGSFVVVENFLKEFFEK